MEAKTKIKTVLVGAGYRGMRLLELLKSVGCYEVVAVFDPAPMLQLSDKAIPVYRESLEEVFLKHAPELAMIVSPWACHVEQALLAVQYGCHVAVEVKGGLAFGEYDSLIALAAQKGVRLFPLENVVFMRENLAMVNLIKDGMLGDLVAMKGGYRHDLRELLINDEGGIGNPEKPEGLWRSEFYLQTNGDLYPTHGLAPLCLAAGINRSDRIIELTSFASRACGMHEYIRKKGGDVSVHIETGDVVVTQMQTAAGVLITLTHDTTLPRPRSLDFEIQGSKGIWQGEFRRIYIEGRSPYETWESDEPYISRYEHRFWKKWGDEALRCDVHHGGMDYIMLRVLAADLRDEEVYPITGEDLALWTSVTLYSCQSIEEKRKISLL